MPLVTLTPAITDGIAAVISWARTRLTESSEDAYISSTALDIKKYLLNKLNDPHLTEEEKIKIVQGISDINTLEIESAIIRVRKAQEIVDRRKATKK